MSLAKPKQTDLIATYRVQLHRDFDFTRAKELADYLADLGISHFYSSPFLQAAAGSTHGYDVVNPRQVNEELGGEQAFEAFRRRLGELGLGLVLDLVPNHMAISGRDNPWWWDVLENGPASRYAKYFDVDWHPPEARRYNQVLLPVLGDHYGRVLEAGVLRLVREGRTFLVRYFDHAFPIAPRSLAPLIAEAASKREHAILAFLADSFDALPAAWATDWDSMQRRHRDKEALLTLLEHLLASEPELGQAIDAVLGRVNADYERLDAVLEQQNYRLAFWRVAGSDLGYRRFFDINTLAGLRMEDQRVFEDTHARVLAWLDEGVLDGLRIDHPDGLRDPLTYFKRLRQKAGDAWIVVEKILESDEPLRDSWPVDGTTGYDFLNRLGGLFVDKAREAEFTRLYHDFTGEGRSYEELLFEKKKLVITDLLGSDLNRLTALFVDVCEGHRRHRDYTRRELSAALVETMAAFPVYRTYVNAEQGVIEPLDRKYIDQAIGQAKRLTAATDHDLLDFLGAILRLEHRGPREAELVMRFEQLSGPAMAKGAEDTAFYCYHRFVALNEVGGNPGRFGTSTEEFHAAARHAATHWPSAMLATSTHDTKRSEDVRARLYLLSEIPGRWTEAVRHWSEHNQRYKTAASDHDFWPDRNTEYLIYQTLVGAWPLSSERLTAYLEKALREAKTHTSWLEPHADYEAAVKKFAESILADREFTASLERFLAPLIDPGHVNALAQTLLKLTAPGVPDIYQGNEVWDFSLVDPDNRRPVDYGARRRLLAELDGLTPAEILKLSPSGAPKLWVIKQALALRRRMPDVFTAKDNYAPLEPRGEARDHVVAFLRGNQIAVVAARLILSLGTKGFGDTELGLGGGQWRNVLTGETMNGGSVPVGALLRAFPVALLVKENS